MLEIEVVEIRGNCPVHRVGDRITIEGPRIVLERTDALCTHALSVLLHYVVALDEGADPVKLGLTKPE
ncbi:MAG: TIGR04076 family protein, partial [Candidatus Bathyarchaeia archaeon]